MTERKSKLPQVWPYAASALLLGASTFGVGYDAGASLAVVVSSAVGAAVSQILLGYKTLEK